MIATIKKQCLIHLKSVMRSILTIIFQRLYLKLLIKLILLQDLNIIKIKKVVKNQLKAKIYLCQIVLFTPKKIFIDTMVHEMIHYYISWNKIKDNGSHGKEFMKIANEMNNKYSLNITIKKDASSYRITKNAPKLLKIKKSLFLHFGYIRLLNPYFFIISTLSLVKII